MITTDLPLQVHRFFSDAQGQLTPQSWLVLLDFQTHPSFLWLSLLPDQTKTVLDLISGHNIIHQLLRPSIAANTIIIGDGILMKFKFIQGLIVVLLIWKSEDPLKIESTKVVTTFLPL